MSIVVAYPVKIYTPIALSLFSHEFHNIFVCRP